MLSHVFSGEPGQMMEADVASVTVPHALELAGQSQCVFLA